MSAYTLLSSCIMIENLVERAKQLGYTHLALTDHNTMYGTMQFIRACEKAKIHPIIGLEADVFYHEKTVPFLLLAKDNAGYAAMIRLASYLSSHEAVPYEEFLTYLPHNQLIVYGEGGWMDEELVHDRREKIVEKLQIMKQELPPFELALSYQEALLWQQRNAMLKRIAQALKIPTAALHKVRYLEPEDARVLRVLEAIRNNTTLADPSLRLLEGRSLLSPAEMAALYAPEDLAETDRIAGECVADGRLARTGLPEYVPANGMDSTDFLTKLCLAGLKKRLGGSIPKAYSDRLEYELSVINKMGFVNYFLIVYDFILEARRRGINVGPGRGSAAGSLVAYCIGITMVDPLRYHLLFERFLNPERVSMPDIDTDIPDDRRDEVIEYVRQKYGDDHTAMIVTFGTFGARSALRDTAKAMGISGKNFESMIKLVPNLPGTTLDKAWQQSARLRQMVEADRNLQQVYTLAKRIEGLPRHASTHAAGIVLSRKPLTDIVPVSGGEDQMKITQYAMEYLEDLGLIKMDFLGLRNLSIIAEITAMVRKRHPAFDLYAIPLDDRATAKIFHDADTMGVFQFESEGMKALLRKVRPESFEDMVAVMALFRPASADSIPRYLENRAHPHEIRYPVRLLQPVLQDTYGVMIYQEQAMLTARIAAGFSLSKADILRKAMSKKKEKEIENLRSDFLAGCRKNGYPPETAEQLFALVANFGGYGFNRSHAVAYGMVAWQMAYLKANEPLPFHTALLNSVAGDGAKTAQYMDACRRRHLKVAAPNILTSQADYTLQDDAILIPLSIIKGIGTHGARVIIAEREKAPFGDFYDFTARMSALGMNRAGFEKLIDAGALDCFQLTRRTMLNGLDGALQYADLVVSKNNGQISFLWETVSPMPLTYYADDAQEKSDREKEALGFNLGIQPVTLLRQKRGIELPLLSALKEGGRSCEGFAVIRDVHQHRTKKGDMMAFVRVSDESGEIDLVVFPRLYETVQPILVRGSFITFRAKISDDGSFLADAIQIVEK